VSKQIGSGAYTNTVTGVGTGAISYTSGTPATATVNAATGEVTLVAVGSTVITAVKAATGTHASVTNTYTLTVTALTPSTILFADGAPSKVYGSGLFLNAVTGGVGNGAITYTSGTPATATVNATTGEVTLVASGTTVITATKAQTGTYAAGSSSYTLTVIAASSTIVFADGAPSRTYGSGSYTNTVTGAGTGAISYTSGTPATATVNPSTGAVTLLAAGTTVITAVKAATATHATVNNSYTLTVTAAPSTIVFADGAVVTKIFGSGAYANAVSGDGMGAITYTSGTPSIATVNASTGALSIVSVGNTLITAVKAASATHSTVTNTFTLIVTKAPSSIAFADGAVVTKVFGSGAYTNTVTGAGTGAIAYTSGTPTTATVNASTGAVTFVGAGNTIITAIKAATATHETVTNTYTLTVAMPTVTDIDGNVYTSVLIGNQIWTVENLKTTHFNDGTEIPLVTGNSQWVNLTTPGYCWFNNDNTNKAKYGALYNWFAANTNTLAPAGWHVPTDAEWSTLENYLIANGYNWDGSTTGNKIAKALAAKSDWTVETSSPGQVGYNQQSLNNRSGFSALPSGYRGYAGFFGSQGDNGDFWSTTAIDVDDAWYRGIAWNGENIYKSGPGEGKMCGFSVRLIRD
jgi:uncharacterized protein (TIGR02145 family)